MTLRTLEPTQRTAARIVGFLYVFTMATAIFAESYVRGRLLVRGDAAKTAENVAAHLRLFRFGVAADLITILGVVVLIWALYVVLEPVGRHLALLGAFLRLAENAVAAAGIIHLFLALRLLAATPYLTAFEQDQLQVLSRVFIGGHGASLQIAFVFLGLGSTVFSWLWLRSRYIPKALAILGIVASMIMSLVGLTFMVFPEWDVVGLTYMFPMFLYEVGLGLWLLVKGLREPGAA